MKSLTLVLLSLLCADLVHSQDSAWTTHRPDGDAPISTIGDHLEPAGLLSLSYRYIPMWMEGNLLEITEVTADSLLGSYDVAPRNMLKVVHMLGAEYALSDRVTLVGMTPYVKSTMSLQTDTTTIYDTESSGIGDIGLRALVRLWHERGRTVHGHIGLSIPTGSIQQSSSQMPVMSRLGYIMQLGSGTWDPMLGVTAQGQYDVFSWGSQMVYKFRLGKNGNEYRLGNVLDLNLWGAILLGQRVSLSTSLIYISIDPIVGADPELAASEMPLLDAKNSGRNNLDIGLGANIYGGQGKLKNFRLAVEFKLPLYQKARGVQLNERLGGIVGVHYIFGLRSGSSTSDAP